VLEPLSDEAMMRILLEPRNALVKQYTRLFEMEGVKLTFEQDALLAIIREARRRKTGARALRAIAEETLMEAFFDIPSRKDVGEVIVGADTVVDKKPARFVELKKKSA